MNTVQRSHHYVTLSSGASKNLFPNNKSSSFRTKLCETLTLQPVSTYWECAATLVMVPANYYNINNYCRTIEIRKSKRSKAEIAAEYTVAKWVYHTYVIPPDLLNHFSAEGFVRHVNNSMLVSDHKYFKLELSTVGAESARLYPKLYKPVNADDAVFVFKIGKKSKIVLNEEGREFWRAFLKIPSNVIGQEIVQSFTVPIIVDPKSLFIRIYYPFSIRIYTEKDETVRKEFIPKIFPDDDTQIILMNIGSYKNEKAIVEELKARVDETIVEKNDTGVRQEVLKFTLNHENKITIEIAHPRYAFKFTDDLAYALGFKKDVWYDETINKALLPVDLHYNLNVVYVYTDIIESSIISNVRAPLLTLLPIKQKSQERVIAHYFPRLFYYPVNKTSISEIAISMAGDFGKEIPFTDGIETTIKLHFRVFKE